MKVFIFSFLVCILILKTHSYSQIWSRYKIITVQNNDDFEIPHFSIQIDTESLISSQKLDESCFGIEFFVSNEKVDWWLEHSCNTVLTTFWIDSALESGSTVEVYFFYGIAVEFSQTSGQERSTRFFAFYDGDCPIGTTNYDRTIHENIFNERYLKSSGFPSVNYFSTGINHFHNVVGGNTESNIDTNLDAVDTIKTQECVQEVHYHPYDSFDVGTSSLPPTIELNVCSSLAVHFHSGAIMLFNTTGSSIPSNWDIYSVGANSFIRGSQNTSTVGNMYGNEVHTHDVPVFGVKEPLASFHYQLMIGGDDVTTNTHTHTLNPGQTTVEASSSPEFVAFPAAKMTSTAPHYELINENMIFITSEIPPFGYDDLTISSFFLNKYFRISSDNTVQTGGNMQHNHEVNINTDTSGNLTPALTGGGSHDGAEQHSHDIITVTSHNSNELPYYGVYIVRKRKVPNVVVSSLTLELVQFPTLTLYVVSSLLIFLFSCIFVFVCFFVVICSSIKVNWLELMKGNQKIIIGDKVDQVMIKSTHSKSMTSLKGPRLKLYEGLFKIKFDDIKVEKKIGSGGSESVVFKAKWDGRMVAFKCFKINDFYDTDEDKFKQFNDEASLMASLNHPNILQFFGATIKQPRIGIVMEYCEKGDLRQYLTNNDINLQERYKILVGIISGMAYLHERGVIHRDLKAENVLMKFSDDDMLPKIIDFGLSRFDERLSNNTKTRRIGTSYYMAPEVTLGGDYDFQCDVFSFSMLCWIVLTNNFNPFGDGPMGNIELKIAQNPNFRPSLNDLNNSKGYKQAGYDKWLTAVVERGWSNDPGDRDTFNEMKKVFLKHSE